MSSLYPTLGKSHCNLTNSDSLSNLQIKLSKIKLKKTCDQKLPFSFCQSPGGSPSQLFQAVAFCFTA